MKNHILIVEDDEAIREGVRILLEGEGYTVQEAEDGFSLKATDMVMTCDGDTMAKGYFKGQMRKVTEGLPDLFGDQADYIHNLEALDWKEVRDDTEGFVNDVLGKTSFSVFMDDDK